MNSTSPQFVSSRRMAAYEPIHQMSMWGENFKSNGSLSTSAPIIVEADTELSNQVQMFEIYRACLIHNPNLIL